MDLKRVCREGFEKYRGFGKCNVFEKYYVRGDGCDKMSLIWQR